jgi:prevent-host-death family protein
MPVVNMHEAKTHLAELVRRVQQGETFIIARAGHPVAQLIRLGASPLPRRAGSLAGVMKMDEEIGMPEPARIHGPRLLCRERRPRGFRVMAGSRR